MKTFTKICLFALVMFVSGSLMAQQSYLNTTSKTAPNKLEWIQKMHGPTVSAPASPNGSKAVGDDCDNPIIIAFDNVEDLFYNSGTQSTATSGNTYSNTCLNDFDEGNDVIFQLELAFDTTLYFELTPDGLDYSGMALNETCFGDPSATCLAISTDLNNSGNAHGFALALEAGTYYIMVDNWPDGSKAGGFSLSIAPISAVPNDDCAYAAEVGLMNQQYYSTLEATPSTGGAPDVWFKYTAGFTGTLGVDVCDSDFDTYLWVWDDCAGTNLLALNDNACGFDGLQSSLSLSVTMGTTYLIQVTGDFFTIGFDTYYSQGTGYLNLYEVPAPCALVCPPGGTDELEAACPANDNGSCATAVEVFTGDTICGNLWTDNDVRDTDWFKLEIASISSVKLAVIGEASTIFGMVYQQELGNLDCANLGATFAEYKITPGCVEDSIEFLNLPVGTYYFVVAHSTFSGQACPGYDYQAAFTVEANATGTVEGTVDDGTTGIQGVTVTVDIFSTTTDINGDYSLTVPVGTYDVIANGLAQGFSKNIKTGEVVADGGTTTVDFSLYDDSPTLTAAANIDYSWAKLNWTPLPGPTPKGGLKGTDVVMGEVINLNNYTPGATMDLKFTLIVYTPESFTFQDYGLYFEITLPGDLTVNSSPTLFPAVMISSFPAVINGQTVSWGDGSNIFWVEENEGYHQIDFTINVTVDGGAVGPQVADFYFAGDEWTGPPGDFDGLVTIFEEGGNYVETFNVYRKLDDGTNVFIPLVKNIPDLELYDVIYNDVSEATVAGDWCYYVTQNIFDGGESASSDTVCVELKDPCDDAIDYGVPGDAAQNFTMDYAEQIVWFQVELPTDMDISVSTCGSDFNTAFAIYEDCASIPVYPDMVPDNAMEVASDGCTDPDMAVGNYCDLDAGTYYIAVYGEGGEFGDIELEITLVHCLTIYGGWSGFSTYMEPKPTDSLEVVLAPMADEMVLAIRQNPYGIWWPAANINTIDSISPRKGYKSKMTAAESTIITGTEVVSKTVNLPAGASYLPVKVPFTVNIAQLENQVGDDLLLIYNIYNGQVLWPDGGLQTLFDLEPGFAYLINMKVASSYDYPSAKSVGAAPSHEPVAFKGVNEAWNEVINTGRPHIIAIDNDALANVELDDVIGAFDAEGVCVGVATVDSKDQNLQLIVFGNDEYTEEVKDGFGPKEAMSFKLYRPSMDEQYALGVTYSPDAPNSDGTYEEMGMSIITALKVGATDISENVLANVNIYPNPSNGQLTIDGLANSVEVSISNAQGQLIFSGTVADHDMLDLSSQAKGVYFVKLLDEGAVRIQKIILK